MFFYYKPTKPANASILTSNIVFLLHHYLPISSLISAFLALAWTPNLIQKSIIIEVGAEREPNLLHYLITFIFFTTFFSSVAIVRALIQASFKRKFNCKPFVACVMIGEILGLLLGITILSRSRFFCGNTLYLMILFFQVITLLFWASVGYLVGVFGAVFSEKTLNVFEHYALKRKK